MGRDIVLLDAQSFLRPARCVALLACIVWTTGCATSSLADWVPRPAHAADLPSSAEALLALADAAPRTSADANARALAAMESLDALGEAQGYNASWRHARAAFYLADLLPNKDLRKRYAQQGKEAGSRAIALEATRVEGHYYAALNAAKLVEFEGKAKGLKPLLESAKQAVELDPTFDNAGPLVLTGKVLMVAPEWPAGVGDREGAIEHLKRAVSAKPNALNKLFLGQAFYYAEEHKKATRMLKTALKQGEREGLASRWLDEAREYLNRIGGQ